MHNLEHNRTQIRPNIEPRSYDYISNISIGLGPKPGHPSLFQKYALQIASPKTVSEHKKLKRVNLQA